MNCFMFPGQPLAIGAPLPHDRDADQLRELVCTATGLDLDRLAETESSPVSQSVRLQVYGVAVSLYRFRGLLAQGVRPDVVAEHSMGIYASLAACGALTEQESIEITFRTGQTMTGLAGGERYALGCVVGLTVEPFLAICENHQVHPANLNTSRHFLLAGERADVESAVAEALSAGAFSARTFTCDAPLHTPLMEPHAGLFRTIFSEYRYREPHCRLMEHINQDFLTAGELAEFMTLELCRPVHWERTYLALRRLGVTRFLEVGSGDSLKKYNRWIDGEQDGSGR